MVGAGAPLSTELVSRGISCCPVDIIRDGPAGDLLDDSVYDRLVRLKKEGDGGPRPIRTVEFPEGGQVSLEQPRNSLSWLTMEVQEFLKRISADLNVIPACSVGMSVHKHWLFASSWRPLQALASRCDRPYTAHADVKGVKDSSGDWASRRTAEFPTLLSQRFADLIMPVFSPGPEAKLLSCDEALGMVPCKPHNALPRANQDGGGIFSLPDWSSPPPGQCDHLRSLRHLWTEWLAAHHIPIRLRQHVQQESEEPLFSEAEVAELRKLTSAWFAQQGVASVSWDIPEFQPYCLSALQAIAAVVSDKDDALWPALLRGVPTGINGDIPRSNVFVPVQAEESVCTEELIICQENWKQATEQPELLAQLVQKEVQEGWVFSVPDLETARARWEYESFSHNPRGKPSQKSDLRLVQASGKRLWLRVAAQRDITCYEILAQHALLCLVAARLPTGLSLEVAHVPGVCNDDADMLSRTLRFCGSPRLIE
ncbi:unnamed protein product, partial [Symbiodinium necroappetens]